MEGKKLNRKMLGKKPEEDMEEEVSGNGKKGWANAELVNNLAQYTFDTPRDRMPEMTNIPLDQVRPQGMIHMYAKEVRLLEELIIGAQLSMNELYMEYHPDSPVPVDLHVWLDDYKENNNELLSDEYQFRYYQLRRSLGGDHKFNAVTLARDQIESQSQVPSEEDFLERLKTQ